MENLTLEILHITQGVIVQESVIVVLPRRGQFAIKALMLSLTEG